MSLFEACIDRLGMPTRRKTGLDIPDPCEAGQWAASSSPPVLLPGSSLGLSVCPRVRSINASGHKFGPGSTWGWLDPYAKRRGFACSRMSPFEVKLSRRQTCVDIAALNFSRPGEGDLSVLQLTALRNG